VLEYNVRFGDPECQPLLAMMASDLVPVLQAVAAGDLGEQTIEWRDGAAMCVVLAAGGYPSSYEKGKLIAGLDAADNVKDLVVFHAGTKQEGDQLVTSGGRVLGVTGYGADLAAAAAKAYEGANLISWDEMRMRRDIGHRAL